VTICFKTSRRHIVLNGAQWLLGLSVLAYFLVFGYLTWSHHGNFGTFGFDMGIHDQGIWLLSRFQEPFVTVRGLDYFGHHANLSTIFLVPFYWLGAGPRFLYLFETAALALGAIPLWLIARHRLGHSWLALAPALAYLFYPTLEWINWWHFHPDALAVAPLLFAWWFALVGRWWAFSAAVLLALMAKEDASLAVTVMGALIACRAFLWPVRAGPAGAVAVLGRWYRRLAGRVRGNRALLAGVATAAAGIAWWFLATKWFIPSRNDGGGPFYAEWFPGFGSSAAEVMKTIVTDPGKLFDTVSTEAHGAYFLKLFSPTAFLSLLSPATWIAAPQLLVNSISSHGYTHDFRFHYNSVVIAGVFLGTVEAIGWAGARWALARFVLPLAVLVSCVISNIHWSPSPLGRQFDSGIWARPGGRQPAVREALELIPDRAGVTAMYYMVPHLTHRRLIYEFPNPFRPANWGVGDENPGDPGEVDYLVVNRRLTGNDTRLYGQLVSDQGPFRVIYSKHDIEVARRKRGN